MLTEFIPHLYSTFIHFQKNICRLLAVYYYQSSSLICTLHPSCRRRSVALEFILHLHSSLHSFQKTVPSLQHNVNRLHPHLHSSSILFRWRSVTRLAVNLITEFSKTSAFFIHSFQKKDQSPPCGILATEIIRHLHSSTILFRRRSVASRYSVYSVNVTSSLFIRTLHPPFSGEGQWPRGNNPLTELISLPFFWRRNVEFPSHPHSSSTSAVFFIHSFFAFWIERRILGQQ
jgi:hypothetical protein